MRQIHKNSICCLAVIIAGILGLSAAPSVKQVIIASGGHYGSPGNKVTFYAYDPKLKSTKAFDSVPGNFTREAIVDNGIIYVTADSVLYRYNADTYKKIDSIFISGVNRMLINGNYLVVARWFPDSFGLVQVYNKISLKLLYSDNNLNKNSYCKSIIALRDTAYIAVTTTDSGRIAMLDLTGSTPKYAGIINMDTTATYMQDLATDGEYIYTFSYDYAPGYKTRINAYQIATRKHKWIANGGMRDLVGYSAAGNNKVGCTIYGKISSQLQDNALQGFNYAGTPDALFSLDYYRGALDSIDKSIYLIDNNFVSNNKIYVMGLGGLAKDTFMVGASTEAVAVDYRLTTSIAETEASLLNFSLFPNPASNIINIFLEQDSKSRILITDITGKQWAEYSGIQNKFSLPVSQLPQGVYTITVISDTGFGVKKFVKE